MERNFIGKIEDDPPCWSLKSDKDVDPLPARQPRNVTFFSICAT